MPQGWTPDQIKQFQDYWDAEFAGDLAKRRRAKFVPGDTAAKVHQTKEPEQKNDFDEWLARIICYAFSVPPQWAVKLMNRATADNQSAQAEQEGLEPTKEWVKDLVDSIIADEFASPDLELHWLDEDDANPSGLEAVLEGRVKIGAATLNEMRDALGLDPFDNPAADRAMVLTATGYVPIEANAGGEGTAAASASERGAGADEKISKTSLVKASPDDPEHPGWPAGTPGGKGGQFRPKDSDGGEASNNMSETADRAASVQSAALESGTVTDASNQTSPADEGHLAGQNGSTTGLFWATRNQKIDQTSFALLAILTQVVDRIGPRGALSPSEYGTKVHTEFAAAVRAEGLEGVEVEQTFGLEPDDPYGAEGSIRTDVLLRDSANDIVAIWDVKTGNARLKPWRVREIRATTGTSADTYVFELNVDRGVVLKYRRE